MESSINYINPGDFRLIIQAIPGLKLRKFDIEAVQMLFKISYYCALRINETIGIRKSDIDLDRQEIFLGKTKTKRGDRASIAPSFIAELGVYLRSVQNDEPLFKGMNKKIVWVWTKKLGKTLGLKAWITPQSESGEKTKSHIFRKTYAKDLLYGTFTPPAPLSIIQKKLRHADLKTTSKYLQVDLDEVKAWEKLESPKPV